MLTITQEAKEYLDKVRNDDYVTLGVKGGGCSGFTYVWDFKNNWPDVVWSEPYEDALVLDPMAEMFVAGCTIDYKFSKRLNFFATTSIPAFVLAQYSTLTLCKPLTITMVAAMRTTTLV